MAWHALLSDREGAILFIAFLAGMTTLAGLRRLLDGVWV